MCQRQNCYIYIVLLAGLIKLFWFCLFLFIYFALFVCCKAGSQLSTISNLSCAKLKNIGLQVQINPTVVVKGLSLQTLTISEPPSFLQWNSLKIRGSSAGGGALELFFGGYVPRRFQNVRSRERIFLEKWGSWEQKFGKIWVWRARILAKTWLKMQKFSKNWKRESQERRNDGKLVGKGAATGLKKGGHDRGTSLYPFPMWVAPLPRVHPVENIINSILSGKFCHFFFKVSLTRVKKSEGPLFASAPPPPQVFVNNL